MHIENFKVFADLVASKNFSKAATLNGVTQSAVSQQLRMMELHYAAALLDRSQKRFHLTREGELLHAAAKEIVRLATRAEAEIKAMRERIDGTIRLSAIHSIGLYELPAVVKRFLTNHPNVNFRIEYRRHNVVLEDVEQNSSDFGLVAYAQPTAALEVVPFAEDNLIAICSPSHALASRNSVTLRELADIKFVNYDHDIPSRKAVDEACQKKRITLLTVMESDNVETIKRAVEVGVGVALVPASIVRQELAQGTLIGLRLKDCVIGRPLSIIYRKGFVLTPAMKLFIKMMSHIGHSDTVA